MITFHKVTYRNFLSTGHAGTTTVLDQHPTTLIVGVNGAGKTTLLDALCFALYGKPFRNINKPLLINSINGKDMVVDVEFSTQNNRYVVRRGMKPTVFEIICNGEPIPELPSAAEMQDYLEKYILKCNYKAFTQVVILGASSYVPFMRLTPAARREILEDVLDIEVFSVMHALVKTRIGTTKDELSRAQSTLAVIESQHRLAQTYAEQWAQQQQERRDSIDQQIATATTNIATLGVKRGDIETQIAEMQPQVDKLPELQEKHTKASKLVTRFATQRKQLTESREFFTTHAQCPTCTQSIEEGFKTTQLSTLEERLGEVVTNHEDTKQIVAKLTKRISAVTVAQKALQSFIVQRKQVDEQIRAAQREHDRLTKERERTFEPAPAPPADLGDIDAAQQQVSEIQYRKHVLEQGYNLLKDNGIRTKIVQHYLPTINSFVNSYLAALNFPIQFTLDDQFNESILSRHRDAFSYENFSEGEKRRIDLALVLTWRAIARLKNSVYTNLLIFDEVFDSSLDISGTDDFMQVLQTLDKDTNIFVISHKTDVMIDKFAHVLTATKERGFSVVSPL